MVPAQSLSGFDMSIWVGESICTLSFDGWTEEFEDEAVAARLFVAALRGDARLKVDCIAAKRWRWTLETLDEANRWCPQSTLGHAVWRIWGARSVVHLRNAFPNREREAQVVQGEYAATSRPEPAPCPFGQSLLPPSVA